MFWLPWKHFGHPSDVTNKFWPKLVLRDIPFWKCRKRTTAMDGRRALAILYIYYIQAHISAQVRQKASMVRMTNSENCPRVMTNHSMKFQKQCKKIIWQVCNFFFFFFFFLFFFFFFNAKIIIFCYYTKRRFNHPALTWIVCFLVNPKL